MGFPLDRGSVEDGTLTCHWHHARFDLASGCTFDLWADDVPTCLAEVRDGEVWLRPIFSHADAAAHWRQRLDDGLAHVVGLVIAKAVHGQLAAGVPPSDVVRQVALFGIQNRDGWGVGLTILTGARQPPARFAGRGDLPRPVPRRPPRRGGLRRPGAAAAACCAHEPPLARASASIIRVVFTRLQQKSKPLNGAAEILVSAVAEMPRAIRLCRKLDSRDH
jgi:hypothetical protein